MNYNKLILIVISVLMVILIPIILYAFNFNSVAFDNELYKNEFSKYNVYNQLKNYNIEEINSDVLDYLQNEKNEELITNNFFNEREKTHLLDVKTVIQKVLLIYYFSIILFLLLFFMLILLLKLNFKNIVKKLLIILIIGSLLTFLDAVLFFLLSNFYFDFTFNLLHTTFFNPGTFTFNPQIENIVVLYPENLFFDLLAKIILNTILSSIILLFLCLMLLFIFFRPFYMTIIKKFPSVKIKNRKL